MSKYCLNMIVKDEEENIIGCLKNVAHLCDAIAIVDTGSTDKTVKIIEKFMKVNNIPGEVIVRPWFGFNISRTEALRFGEDVIFRLEQNITEKPKPPKRWKPSFTTNMLSEQEFLSGNHVIIKSKDRDNSVYTGDQFLQERLETYNHTLKDTWFLMFMDADNRLYANGTVDDSKERFKVNKEDKNNDQYGVDMRQGSICYRYTWMVRLDPRKRWIWNKVIHEHVVPHNWVNPSRGKHCGGYILSGRTGSRNKDPCKYLGDAVICEREMKTNPKDDHYYFYGAQSYRDSHKYDEAIKLYLKRAEMKGWMEQVYISYYEAGKLQYALEPKKPMKALEYLYKAYEVSNLRLEAAYFIVEIFRNMNLFKCGWEFAKPLIDLPKPVDLLFVDEHIHGWMFYDTASVCAYYAGDKKGSKMVAEKALASGLVPDAHIDRIKTTVTLASC